MTTCRIRLAVVDIVNGIDVVVAITVLFLVAIDVVVGMVAITVLLLVEIDVVVAITVLFLVLVFPATFPQLVDLVDGPTPMHLISTPRPAPDDWRPAVQSPPFQSMLPQSFPPPVQRIMSSSGEHLPTGIASFA